MFKEIIEVREENANLSTTTSNFTPEMEELIKSTNMEEIDLNASLG